MAQLDFNFAGFSTSLQALAPPMTPTSGCRATAGCAEAGSFAFRLNLRHRLDHRIHFSAAPNGMGRYLPSATVMSAVSRAHVLSLALV